MQLYNWDKLNESFFDDIENDISLNVTDKISDNFFTGYTSCNSAKSFANFLYDNLYIEDIYTTLLLHNDRLKQYGDKINKVNINPLIKHVLKNIRVLKPLYKISVRNNIIIYTAHNNPEIKISVVIPYQKDVALSLLVGPNFIGIIYDMETIYDKLLSICTDHLDTLISIKQKCNNL